MLQNLSISACPTLGAAGFGPGFQTTALVAMVLGAMLIVYALHRKVLGRSDESTRASASETSDALKNDLTELTERLVSELDHRAGLLERLLAEADAKIRSLERAATIREAPLIETRPTRRRDEPLSTADSLHQEVYSLADQGLTPVAIAQKLERPTGQIELVLNLRRGTVKM